VPARLAAEKAFLDALPAQKIEGGSSEGLSIRELGGASIGSSAPFFEVNRTKRREVNQWSDWSGAKGSAIMKCRVFNTEVPTEDAVQVSSLLGLMIAILSARCEADTATLSSEDLSGLVYLLRLASQTIDDLYGELMNRDWAAKNPGAKDEPGADCKVG